MENRWSTRINVYQRITLEIPSYKQRVVTATLLDISLYGAFIETQVLLPDDAALIIELKLPGDSVSLRLNARMVRRTPRGVGVEFVGIPASTANALSEAVCQYKKQLEPIKPDLLSGFVMNKVCA